MTDLAIQQAEISKLEAENKTLKAQNNEYAKRICQQQITIEHLTASENVLLGDLITFRAEREAIDKEIDQLRKIVAPKRFLKFVDEKEISIAESKETSVFSIKNLAQ